VLHGIYTPTFGWDTMRDAIIASQIVESGNLKRLTIVHEAYPIPVVPLLYAMLSTVTNIDALWTTSIVGLLYLTTLSIWTYLIAKHNAMKYSHVAVILAVTNPLIVVWSVWFIPQAYSLLMSLPLMFLNLNPITYSVFAVTLVLGHGGFALFTLTVLMLQVFIKKIYGVKASMLHSAETKFIIVSIIFVLYAMYTTLSMVLKGASSSVVTAILAFLSGEKIVESTIALESPELAIFSIIPIVVLVVFGFTLLIGEGDLLTRLLSFISLLTLGLSFLASVAYPLFEAPRYLGLGAATILTVLTPKAIKVLAKRGFLGALYALVLIALSVISFGFAGTLMPENPYTANPYGLYSVSGAIKCDEVQELESIVFKLCCDSYLIDWKAGTYMRFKYLWTYTIPKGFYFPNNQCYFLLAGHIGFLVTPNELEYFNGTLIFRFSAMDIPTAFSKSIVPWLKEYVHNHSVLYNSKNIQIIKFLR
jgi:hypothetical protein